MKTKLTVATALAGTAARHMFCIGVGTGNFFASPER